MKRYCLDTNAFIEPWHRRYPIDVFPGFWDHLVELIDEGFVLSPDEVRREIEKLDDDLLAWLKKRCSGLFRPLDNRVQEALQDMYQRYEPSQRLVDSNKGRSIADPWVIAQAIADGAIVVTEETPGSTKRQKIPDVCDGLNVEHMTVLEFIRDTRLKFERVA